MCSRIKMYTLAHKYSSMEDIARAPSHDDDDDGGVERHKLGVITLTHPHQGSCSFII